MGDFNHFVTVSYNQAPLSSTSAGEIILVLKVPANIYEMFVHSRNKSDTDLVIVHSKNKSATDLVTLLHFP